LPNALFIAIYLHFGTEFNKKLVGGYRWSLPLYEAREAQLAMQVGEESSSRMSMAFLCAWLHLIIVALSW
jgi:hypothetical protein